MRSGLRGGCFACLLLAGVAWGDEPTQVGPNDPPVPVAPTGPGADPSNVAAKAETQGQSPKDLQEALDKNIQAIRELREEHARELERQKKLAELQQRQIEVLEQTTRVMSEQIKRTTPVPTAVENLTSKTAALDARSQQADRRDVELATVANQIQEQVDAMQRNVTKFFPYTARELFLPGQTNETPVSIYGQIVGGYNKFNGQTGTFLSPEVDPWILVQLNNKFLLEMNFYIGTTSIDLTQAQVDWFVGNNLTVSAGRFLTPIGAFNERLSPQWINKLPDNPIMFNQVIPLTSTDGIQLRGSKYLGSLPFKLEYSAYLGDGFQLTQQPTAGQLNRVADLGLITNGPDQTNSKAYGGRLGMWIPRSGVNFGFSGYTNGVYSPGLSSHYSLWDFDISYHKGNWDFRTEYGGNQQQAGPVIGHDIHRQGLYSQLAYRNYAAKSLLLSRLEVVFRYGFESFSGINPSLLDQSVFGSPLNIPVNRDQYTFGLNYYFYPSMALRVAYEINREHGLNLHDDVFMAQAVWAF
jgi:hypothetical protein